MINEEYFTNNLCDKLNVVNLHFNVLVQNYYPDLYVRWKNLDIGVEYLLSSYLISIFTSFLYDENDFVLDFWDIILLVESLGKVVRNSQVRVVHYRVF